MKNTCIENKLKILTVLNKKILSAKMAMYNLPIIRTSVDHGTALELAGSGRGDCRSLEAALNLAVDIARRDGVA